MNGYYSCARDFQPRRLYPRPRAESMTVDAFRTETALMLERLGHPVISNISDIVTLNKGANTSPPAGRRPARYAGQDQSADLCQHFGFEKPLDQQREDD